MFAIVFLLESITTRDLVEHVNAILGNPDVMHSDTLHSWRVSECVTPGLPRMESIGMRYAWVTEDGEYRDALRLGYRGWYMLRRRTHFKF